MGLRRPVPRRVRFPSVSESKICLSRRMSHRIAQANKTEVQSRQQLVARTRSNPNQSGDVYSETSINQPRIGSDSKTKPPSSDQTLNLQTIYLKDITPNCSSTSLNPQTLPTDPTQHSFPVSRVLTDSSVMPVSIDTSLSNFYFTRNHCYQLTLVTDKGIFGLPGISYT